MWLHFFPVNSQNSLCTVIRLSPFLSYFNTGDLKDRGHYLTIIQLHNERYLHFWLEYCNWFVFGTKWGFALSPCTLLSVTVLSKINKLICPYRCFHAHVNISWRNTPMVPFTHTHTPTNKDTHTHAVTNTQQTGPCHHNEWNSSCFPLYPPSVTVTIMIYVCLIL